MSHVRPLLVYILSVFAVAVAQGQRLCPKNQPSVDMDTSLLLRFDSPSTSVGTGSASVKIEGQAVLVDGKFGTGAKTPKDGLLLTSARQPFWDVNQGTMELYFKADHPEWFAKSHGFIANEAGFDKVGCSSLWFWTEPRELRFDHHTFGKLFDAYITAPMPQDTRWHHFAASWDYRRGIKLFIDGNLVAERQVTWEPVTLTAEERRIRTGSGLENGVIDEVRFSSRMRFGTDEHFIDHAVAAGESRIENGKTIKQVTCELVNRNLIDTPLEATIEVVDYFQTPQGRKPIQIKAKAGEKLTYDFPVVCDQAGPYVKVILHVREGEGDHRREWTDEQIFFTDVLTGPRIRLSLDGPWDVFHGGDPMKIEPPKTSDWFAYEFPRRDWTWKFNHTKWFRKRFVLSKSAEGKKVELALSGVRFRADVFLNGESVGGQDTDQMPYTVDLTKAVKPNQKNELLIAVTDWLSCVKPELKESLKGVGADNQGAGISGRVFIRPCTGMISPAGIMDPIFLHITDSIAVEQVYLTPSVRKGSLKVQAVLENRTSQPQKVLMTLQMIDKESTVMRFEPISGTIRPGRSEWERELPVDVKKLVLWQPKKPYLYRFRVELSQADRVIDRYDVRFGFREFWCDGPVFRINGVPIKPAVAAGWPYVFPGFSSQRGDWYADKRYLASLFDLNVLLFRYHTEPYPIMMFDMADELGLMIASEALMSTIPLQQDFGDARFWKNCREFYPRWVLREFNHPCLVIRSIENEGGYLIPQKGPSNAIGSEAQVRMARDELLNLGRTVKRLDPSRPIMYDGSGPMFYSVADIYNIHYPGIPGMYQMYPITSRWISFPNESYNLSKWLWDRQKPLYVGESDAAANTPTPLAGAIGPSLYRDQWNDYAKEILWSYSVQGQRIDGITATFPWCPLESPGAGAGGIINPQTSRQVKVFQKLMTPIVTFVPQYRSCYFEKRRILRTLTTLNDSLEPAAITIKWRFTTVAGTELQKDELTFTLNPAESRKTQIQLAMPGVDRATAALLTVETWTNGKKTYQVERPFEIFPDRLSPFSFKARWGLLGLSDERFRRLGLSVRTLENQPLDLHDLDVLAISGKISRLSGREQRIADFLQKGGRLIVLGGEKTPEYLPVKLKLNESKDSIALPDDADPSVKHKINSLGSAATMVFPGDLDHPILRGLNETHLRFWQENHLITSHTFSKTADFYAKSLLTCGEGLKSSSLLEIPCDRGTILAVQMPVLELFDEQPCARVLLENLCRYVDGLSPRRVGQLGILAEPQGPIEKLLLGLDIEAVNLSGRLGATPDLSVFSAILVESSESAVKELTANKSAISSYLKNGGFVWVHQPKSGQFDSLLPGIIRLKPLYLETPIRVINHGPMGGVASDDLFWSGEGFGTLSPRVADQCFETKGQQATLSILADPAVIAFVKIGQGGWLFDTIRWESEFQEYGRARNFIQTILGNLGQPIRKHLDREEPLALGFRSIDLASYCNSGFVGGLWNGPTMGLRKLPVGKQVFRRIPYSIVDPARNDGKSCIGFYSATHNAAGHKRLSIPIGSPTAGINLLLTSLWSGSMPLMTKLVNVQIEYADGSRIDTEILYTRDVQDWCRQERTSEIHHPAIAWVGPEFPHPGLYRFLWNNPHPEKPVRTMTFISENQVPFVVLVAITVQGSPTEQKKAKPTAPGLLY